MSARREEVGAASGTKAKQDGVQPGARPHSQADMRRPIGMKSRESPENCGEHTKTNVDPEKYEEICAVDHI